LAFEKKVTSIKAEQIIDKGSGRIELAEIWEEDWTDDVALQVLLEDGINPGGQAARQEDWKR
jgi:hypothetical protein